MEVSFGERGDAKTGELTLLVVLSHLVEVFFVELESRCALLGLQKRSLGRVDD